MKCPTLEILDHRGEVRYLKTDYAVSDIRGNSLHVVVDSHLHRPNNLRVIIQEDGRVAGESMHSFRDERGHNLHSNRRAPHRFDKRMQCSWALKKALAQNGKRVKVIPTSDTSLGNFTRSFSRMA